MHKLPDNFSEPTLSLPQQSDQAPRSLMRRDFLLALGAMSIASCDNQRQQKVDNNVVRLVDVNHPKDRRPAEEEIQRMTSIIKNIPEQYRRIDLRDYENIEENLNLQIDVLNEAIVNLLVAIAIMKGMRWFNICINAAHLVNAKVAAEELIKSFSDAKSIAYKQAVALDKKSDDAALKYYHKYATEYSRNKRKLDVGYTNNTEFQAFVRHLETNAVTFVLTSRERELLMGNSIKYAVIATGLSVLAKVLDELHQVAIDNQQALEKLGCQYLDSRFFSNSKLINALVGDVMGEKKKTALVAIDTMCELEPKDLRLPDVERVQTFLVNCGYLPNDEDPLHPAVDGNYGAKSQKAAFAFKSTIRFCERMHSHGYCVNMRFVPKAYPNIEKFQNLLKSLGYMAADTKPTGVFDHESLSAYDQFRQEILGLSALSCGANT